MIAWANFILGILSRNFLPTKLWAAKVAIGRSLQINNPKNIQFLQLLYSESRIIILGVGKPSSIDSFERKITVKVWIWDGPSPWYFVTVPKKESAEIKKKFGVFHRGWGSIPVKVRIGSSTWKTSIFWEKKGTYLLPVKKEIRKAENIGSGNVIIITLLIENIL